MTEPIVEENAGFTAPRPGLRRRWKWWLAAVVVFGIAAVLAGLRLQRTRMQDRLLAATPAVAGEDPALVRFATAQARPLFQRNCAVCHGADLRGNTALGAPDLADSTWLYGTGRVFDIERTILYGVRSGRSKTHNVTEMPAYGLEGRLSEGQTRSLVQYLLKLDGRPYEAGAANEGQELYFGAPDCGDCHGPDARGNSDYGAPDLTINVWNSGGDPQSLYDSIYYGRHRVMPAWIGVLSLEQIRALAVYIHAVSHPPAGPAAGDARAAAASGAEGTKSMTAGE